MYSEKEKRKYAKMMGGGEVGIWLPDRFLVGLEYGTASGAVMTQRENEGRTYNDYSILRQHNRRLKYDLEKKEGLKYEYWMCAGVSPDSKLWHLHGIWALYEYISYAKLHEVVSKAWGRIHDSPVVWVSQLYNDKGAMVYGVKHALKNYRENQTSFGKRVLMSRKWFPIGYKIVKKILVRWYLDNRYPDWAEEGNNEEWVSSYGDRQQVPFAKDVMHDLLWRWCNNEAITITVQGIEYVVQGDNIIERTVVENG